MNIKKRIIKAILIILMGLTVLFAIQLVRGFIGSQIIKDENNFTGSDLGEGNKIEQKIKMNCYLFLQV
ncbi:MAG: hypothetical protein ACLTA5_01770 [Anaerococcus obesiensis]